MLNIIRKQFLLINKSITKFMTSFLFSVTTNPFNCSLNPASYKNKKLGNNQHVMYTKWEIFICKTFSILLYFWTRLMIILISYYTLFLKLCWHTYFFSFSTLKLFFLKDSLIFFLFFFSCSKFTFVTLTQGLH